MPPISFDPSVRVVLTILGARSGTSALAGTLSFLGAALPRRLMAPHPSNPKGFFEPRAIADRHDALLAGLGTDWSDPRAMPPGWLGTQAARAARDDLRALFLEEFGGAPLAVLKEPRMGRLLPLWDDVFASVRARPVFVFADRDPYEVAASFRARDGASWEAGLLYYARNRLDAERATRGRPRVFVTYQELLMDWRGVVTRIGAAAGIALSQAAEAEVEAFLEPALRHQRAGGPSPDEPAGEVAAIVHAACNRLSGDPHDARAIAALDDVSGRFEAMLWPRPIAA